MILLLSDKMQLIYYYFVLMLFIMTGETFRLNLIFFSSIRNYLLIEHSQFNENVKLYFKSCETQT